MIKNKDKFADDLIRTMMGNSKLQNLVNDFRERLIEVLKVEIGLIKGFKNDMTDKFHEYNLFSADYARAKEKPKQDPEE